MVSSMGPLETATEKEVGELTVKDTLEADKYNLRPEDYVHLRRYVLTTTRQNFRNEMYAQIQVENEELRKRVAKELRPEIKKELTAEIIAGLQKDFDQEKRNQLRTEIEKELHSTVPSARQRQAAKEQLRSVELEARATARQASDDADRALNTRNRVHIFGFLASFGFTFSIPTVGIYLTHFKNLEFTGSLVAVTIWTLVVAAVLSFIIWGVRVERWVTLARYCQSCSAKYTEIAMDAERCRRVAVDTALTSSELLSMGSNVVGSYRNMLREFAPSLARSEAARKIVQDEILTSMDPEALLRVGSEDMPDSDPVTMADSGHITLKKL